MLLNGIIATKPATRVRLGDPLRVVGDEHRWVGRGALKLLGALDTLGVDPSGLTAADLGASTGGFTEVLLHRGAARVYAIDVGAAQLAWSLQTDPRVVVMDRTNARHLTGLAEPIQLVVGDLSFISLKLILPTVARILEPGGEAVLLVKPQFEVGRQAVGSGGKVRDAGARSRAIAEIEGSARELGFVVDGGCDCEVPGARAGNIEYFLHLSHATRGVPDDGVS